MKTLVDKRDFIGNARNVLATANLSMQNLKAIIDLHDVGALKGPQHIVKDEDFEAPESRTVGQHIDGVLKLNAELFGLIQQLQDFMDQDANTLKSAVQEVQSMNQNSSSPKLG